MIGKNYILGWLTMNVNILLGKSNIFLRRVISAESLGFLLSGKMKESLTQQKLLLVLFSSSRILITLSLTEGRVKQASLSQKRISTFLLNGWVEHFFPRKSDRLPTCMSSCRGTHRVHCLHHGLVVSPCQSSASEAGDSKLLMKLFYFLKVTVCCNSGGR